MSAKITKNDNIVTIELAVIDVYVSINKKLIKIKNDIDSIIRTSLTTPNPDEKNLSDMLIKSNNIINNNTRNMTNIVRNNKAVLATLAGMASTITGLIISSFLSDEEELEAPEIEPTSNEPVDTTELEKNIISGDLGSLSEKYESARSGSAAIGYDTTGGTSYGKYQLASKQGTMDEFVKWAAKQDGFGKEVATALRNAGNFNTGSTSGVAPNVWRRLARQGKLEQLEKDFIKHKYYDVSLAGLNPPLNEIVNKTPLLGSMLWSASVNHGPYKARSMFNSVYKEGMNASEFITAVYDKRIQMVKNNPYADSLITRYIDELNVANSILDTTMGDFKMAEGGTYENVLVLPLNTKGASKIVEALNIASTRLNITDIKLKDYERFFSGSFIPAVGKMFSEALNRYNA